MKARVSRSSGMAEISAAAMGPEFGLLRNRWLLLMERRLMFAIEQWISK